MYIFYVMHPLMTNIDETSVAKVSSFVFFEEYHRALSATRVGQELITTICRVVA